MTRVLDIASGSIVVAFVLFATTQLPRIWRMKPSQRAPVWWQWSDRSYPVLARTLPTAVVTGWPFAATIPWILGWVPAGETSDVAVVVLAAIICIGAVVAASIAVLNRPSWAVPPALRSAPGLISARRLRGKAPSSRL